MAKKESFLVRLDPKVLNAIRRWSADELRSVNAQIDYLLRQSLKQAGRYTQEKSGDSVEAKSPPEDSGQ